MKRLLSTTLAAALAFSAMGTSGALAQNYGPPGFNHQPGYLPHGYHEAPPGGYNGWHRGGYYSGPRTVVTDWNRYHLRPPPRGYEWVNHGGQFVLIAAASGVIADILLSR
jgi:Ni/Co efflux regulator RcnB